MIMYIQKEICLMDPQNTPKRKMTRFSEHPQVFEYSSKSKKQNMSQDNDSLLLDNNLDIELPTNYQEELVEVQKLQPDEVDFGRKEEQIQGLAQQFAQIQAYLNNQSEPIPYFSPQPPSSSQAPESILTSLKGPQTRQRLSFKVKNQLHSGRETMNIEQQTKLKSQLKTLPPSNRKNQQIAQRPIKEQIDQEIKNKNRITMDVNSLLNMINSYEREESERKYREQRKNRITLDVFALSKMVENMADMADNQIKEDIQNQSIVTPIKRPQTNQQSYRKSKIFSSYKNNPTSSQISLQITQYLAQVKDRIKQKDKRTIELNEKIREDISQQTKIKIKINNLKEEIQSSEDEIKEKAQYRDKLLKMLEQSCYQKSLGELRSIQQKCGFGILKYQREKQQNLVTTIAHLDLNGVFIKLKSKHSSQYRLNSKNTHVLVHNQHTDLKIMYSRQLKECQQTFLFSIDENIKILKKYHYKYLSEIFNNGNLLEIAVNLKQAYQNMKTLDIELQYLSLNFEPRSFQINSAMEMLDFDINWNPNFHVMVKINILEYIKNRFNSEAISLYDVNNHKYLNLLKDKPQNKLPQTESLLFQLFKQLIDQYI